MSITYFECVFVVVLIRQAKRMRRVVVIWPARLYRIFPHYLINGTIFGGGEGGYLI